MSDQRDDDATPCEDPRQTGMADQMPEENPEGQGAGSAERQGPESGAGGTDAPDTSRAAGPEDAPGGATATPTAGGCPSARAPAVQAVRLAEVLDVALV